MKSKLLVETLSLDLVSLVKIDDLPFLMSSLVVAPNSNWCSFLILSSLDIENLVVAPVDELILFIFEDLEPS